MVFPVETSKLAVHLDTGQIPDDMCTANAHTRILHEDLSRSK